MAIKQVKPGVYMVTNNGGNSTVRVTEQGIILVDTKNLGDMFYNELLTQIKTASQQPGLFTARSLLEIKTEKLPFCRMHASSFMAP